MVKLINHSQIKTLIGEVLFSLGDKYASEDAVNLVYWTGHVESNYKYIKQLGLGPAKSFWQIEPNTAISQVENYIKYRKNLALQCCRASMTQIKPWLEPETVDWGHLLTVNMATAIIHCRLKYWRVPKPLPTSIEQAGEQWKEYFNTSKGKGSVSKFVSAVKSL